MGGAMDWDEQRVSRRMKLRDLHVLLTVARCGSMGKAAAQLSVSQPAISKAIADMEHALGVRLLDRNPRGVEPTIYARALLDRGVVAFDELKQAARHIEFLANPTTGELRIGSTVAIATSFLPAVIERLTRRYPRLVFHLVAGETSMTYRNLQERKVDLLVAPMFTPMVEEHMDVEMLYDEPLVVVAGASSSWARRRKVQLAELVDAEWILPPLDSLYGLVAAEAFRAAGVNVPRATVFSTSTPVRSALLASGRFLSIVQGSIVRFGSGSTILKVLPIDLPTTRRPIGIITLKNRTLSPVAQLFIDCAHEVAKPLAKVSPRV
jgi:DNA-binding transcriptional LysR family regulator